MCFPYHSLIMVYFIFYSDSNQQEYQKKAECQNITALSCNLTTETPSVHDVHYWARVLVNDRIHGATRFRFKPLAQSENLHAHSCIFVFPMNQIFSIAVFINPVFFISIAVFGPPILSTYTTVSSLHVHVTLPLGPSGVSIRDIIINSKKGPYKTVIYYTLKITQPEWAKRQVGLHLTIKCINIYHIWCNTAN